MLPSHPPYPKPLSRTEGSQNNGGRTVRPSRLFSICGASGWYKCQLQLGLTLWQRYGAGHGTEVFESRSFGHRNEMPAEGFGGNPSPNLVIKDRVIPFAGGLKASIPICPKGY